MVLIVSHPHGHKRKGHPISRESTRLSKEQISSQANNINPSFSLVVLVSHLDKGMNTGIEDLNHANQRKVNGISTASGLGRWETQV